MIDMDRKLLINIKKKHFFVDLRTRGSHVRKERSSADIRRLPQRGENFGLAKI